MTDNPIIRMFTWWNAAFRADDFTAQGFAQHFTDTAPFIVDGGVRGTGPAQIATHFAGIRAACTAVELVVPPLASLCDDAQGFVHYRCTYTADGKSGSEVCMAHARFENGRIARFEVIGRIEAA
ncbi:nuclear transport factor 2 family protein [Novosphingobium sp. Leaf2]|uniref:nuclear transport factor 2 family protein n=1 Tax=Novosphingobium sp. Leaf2 TaxID=1735670 RepID=UPI0006F8F7A6|nr:nuclear transport factor 2 family protein [Novosphingobium sp. Leaf2]KQM18239.1 hypothetical protein ASE49_08390 [Novosphingobium sp. Leaf2]